MTPSSTWLVASLLVGCQGPTTLATDTGSTAIDVGCYELMATDADGQPLPSGLEFCHESGIVHSVTAVSLAGRPPADHCENHAEYSTCVDNDDCTAEADGRCIKDGPCSCSCQYGCLSDSDCGSDAYCDVMGGGACMPMGCRTDADCDDGQQCRWALAVDEVWWAPYDYTLQCTTPEDSCVGDPAYENTPHPELSVYTPDASTTRQHC